MTINASDSWVHRVAVAFDMAFGVTAGLPADVTISTYVGLVRGGIVETHWKWEKPFCIWLANKLDQIEEHHCELARQADIARGQEIIDFLTFKTGDPL